MSTKVISVTNLSYIYLWNNWILLAICHAMDNDSKNKLNHLSGILDGGNVTIINHSCSGCIDRYFESFNMDRGKNYHVIWYLSLSIFLEYDPI